MARAGSVIECVVLGKHRHWYVALYVLRENIVLLGNGKTGLQPTTFGSAWYRYFHVSGESICIFDTINTRYI